jgi:hypothetical protein
LGRPGGQQKIYNLKYGEHKRQKMDVFLPKDYAKILLCSYYTWRRLDFGQEGTHDPDSENAFQE